MTISLYAKFAFQTVCELATYRECYRNCCVYTSTEISDDYLSFSDSRKININQFDGYWKSSRRK